MVYNFCCYNNSAVDILVYLYVYICTISWVDMKSWLTSEEKTHLTFQHYTTFLISVWKYPFRYLFAKNGCFQPFEKSFLLILFSSFTGNVSLFATLFSPSLSNTNTHHRLIFPIQVIKFHEQYPYGQKPLGGKRSNGHAQESVNHTRVSSHTAAVPFSVEIRILVGKVLPDYLISRVGVPDKWPHRSGQ